MACRAARKRERWRPPILQRREGREARPPRKRQGTACAYLGNDGIEELAASEQLKYEVKDFIGLIALVHLDTARAIDSKSMCRWRFAGHHGVLLLERVRGWRDLALFSHMFGWSHLVRMLTSALSMAILFPVGLLMICVCGCVVNASTEAISGSTDLDRDLLTGRPIRAEFDLGKVPGTKGVTHLVVVGDRARQGGVDHSHDLVELCYA